MLTLPNLFQFSLLLLKIANGRHRLEMRCKVQKLKDGIFASPPTAQLISTRVLELSSFTKLNYRSSATSAPQAIAFHTPLFFAASPQQPPSKQKLFHYMFRRSARTLFTPPLPFCLYGLSCEGFKKNLSLFRKYFTRALKTFPLERWRNFAMKMRFSKWREWEY